MNPIKCSYCNEILPIANILQDRRTGKAKGFCLQCREWTFISLSSIRKQIIYLDQSFLSAACLEAEKTSSQNEVRIHSKLMELKRRQRVFVIVSDIHSRETSAIADNYAENRNKLWEFQNDLADGSIACDWDEIFVAQWRRILACQNDSYPLPATDIGLTNPHQLQIGVKIQSKNFGRQRLHRSTNWDFNIVNDELKNIFSKQLESMPISGNANDCLNYVRELWCKDIRQGIASRRKQRELNRTMEQAIRELESGRIPEIPAWEEPSPFRRVVTEVVQGFDEESAFQHWLELLEGDSNRLCAFIKIRSTLEATLLWELKAGKITDNSRKFHRNLGLSRQNDIDHISTFVPYVDVLTTDNSMRNLCESKLVSNELKQFPCKIFSKSNYDKFEIWLDELLVQ
ncbi:hypothetical protein [Nitrosomonas sp. wSCUT-2]